MQKLCIRRLYANAMLLIYRLKPIRETTLDLLNCICAPWFVRWVTGMALNGFLSSYKKLCRLFPISLLSHWLLVVCCHFPHDFLKGPFCSCGLASEFSSHVI